MSNRTRITMDTARGLLFVTLVVATPAYLFLNVLSVAYGGTPWA